jgi:hypothetical protein
MQCAKRCCGEQGKPKTTIVTVVGEKEMKAGGLHRLIIEMATTQCAKLEDATSSGRVQLAVAVR